MSYTLIRKIHRTVALVSSLFFLMIALTGIILNHSYSGYRPALAGVLPQNAVLPAYQPCGPGPGDLAPAANVLAFAGGVEAAGHTSPGGAAQAQYFSQARYGPQSGGPAWNRGGNSSSDVPAASSQQPPASGYTANSWKLLHTSRFLGLSSVVCDLTALALIVTVLTGLYLYFYGLRREKC